MWGEKRQVRVLRKKKKDRGRLEKNERKAYEGGHTEQRQWRSF